jgi:hypothetical protein
MLKIICGRFMSELSNDTLLRILIFLLKRYYLKFLEIISTTTCNPNIYCTIYGVVHSLHQLVLLVGDKIQTL